MTEISNDKVMYIAVVSSLGFLYLGYVLYIVVIQVHLHKLKATIHLFQHIPPEEIKKVVQQFDSNTDDKIVASKENFLTSKRMLLVLVIASLLVTSVCVGLVIYESFTSLENYHLAMQKVRAGNTFLQVLERTKFKILELIMEDGMKLNITKAAFHSEIGYHIQDMADHWLSFRYGEFDNNYRAITGLTTDIDKVVTTGLANCTSSNFTSCSLDYLVDQLRITKTLSDNAYYGVFDTNTILGSYGFIFDVSSSIRILTSQVISTFSGVFSKHVMIISAIVTPISVSVLLLIIYLIYTYMKYFSDEIHQFRQMLNHLPWELLDTDVNLHAYVLNYALSVKGKKSKTSSESASKEKAILEAAVEGGAICSMYGNINIFNESAQKMFGYRSDEVIGTALYELFSQETRIKVASFISNSLNASSNKGETISVQGMRKNKSTFPALLNISVCILGENKNILSCFIKDVTLEKEKDLELAEEKKKSESLLLNILPEKVAHRLQSGETFIADKVDDSTCLFSGIVDFNTFVQSKGAAEIVKLLNIIINGYDSLIPKYKLEKIKTIGEKVSQRISMHFKQFSIFVVGVFQHLMNLLLKNMQRWYFVLPLICLLSCPSIMQKTELGSPLLLVSTLEG